MENVFVSWINFLKALLLSCFMHQRIFSFKKAWDVFRSGKKLFSAFSRGMFQPHDIFSNKVKTRREPRSDPGFWSEWGKTPKKFVNDKLKSSFLEFHKKPAAFWERPSGPHTPPPIRSHIKGVDALWTNLCEHNTQQQPNPKCSYIYEEFFWEP